MQTKFIEIRDAATCIPALAIRISSTDGFCARRAGYGRPLILLIKLTDRRAEHSPHEWDTYTMQHAHLWIEKNWSAVINQQVVDVEYITGKTDRPKVSESVNY